MLDYFLFIDFFTLKVERSKKINTKAKNNPAKARSGNGRL